MTKRPKFQNRIPSFKGFRSFRPLEPEREELPGTAADDPLLEPEEQGTIKRYLRYADTLIHGSQTDASEASTFETNQGHEYQSDETPADNEPIRELPLLSARRSTDKKAA